MESSEVTNADNGRRRRPAWAIVMYDGHPHRLDLAAIERAFFRGLVAGRFNDRASLAQTTGRSRSTVSRFLAGKSTSIKVALAVLKTLGLDFDDVAKPCQATDQRP